MENQVVELYQRIFLRDPSADEIENGLAFLEVNEIASLESELLATPAAVEISSFILPIIGLYQGILLRTPEPGGLEFWNEAISEGRLTFADLIQSFVDTTELQERFPGLGSNISNDELINLFYQNLLGRVPDAEGYVFWLKALNEGSITASSFTAFFINSDEAQDLIGANLRAYFADSLDGVIDDPENRDSLLPDDQGGDDDVEENPDEEDPGEEDPGTDEPDTGNDDPNDPGDTIGPITADAETFTVDENQADVGRIAILDVKPTLVLTGADAALFTIADDGTIKFNQTQDFETPADADSDGIYAFTIVGMDGRGNTTSKDVTVIMADLNEVPLASSVSANANEDGPAVTVAANVVDVDAGDIQTYIIDTTRTLGSVMNNGDGTFSYSPNRAFEDLADGDIMTDSFVYTVTDSGGLTSSATATVTITGVNDAPTLAAGALSAIEDGSPVNLDLASLGNDVDSDDDGTSLTYTISGTPTEGSASLNGTIITFDPGTDFQSLGFGQTRDVVVEVTATDNHGETASGRLTVTVTGVNDKPIATGGTGSVTEDNVLAASGVIEATDVDGDASLSFYVAGSDEGTYGSLSIDTAGVWTYALNNTAPAVQSLSATDSVLDSFVVQVEDNYGAFASVNVDITVNGADEPRSLAAAHLAEGSMVGISTWGNSGEAYSYNEPYIMAEAAKSFGYSTSYTNAINEADMRTFLSSVDAFVVSEIEYGSFPAEVTKAVADFVAAGGTLVVAGSNNNYDIKFMNAAFGWELTEGHAYQSSEFNRDEAFGTVFADNGQNLSYNSAIYEAINTSSLPIGSLSIYNFSSNDAQTSVAVMGFGTGQVTFLAYDYYNAKPVGTQDGGWVEAFRDGLSVSVEKEAIVTLGSLPLENFLYV